MLLVKRHFVNVSRNSKNSFGNSNQYPILVRRGQEFSTGLPLPSTALAMKPRSSRSSVRLIRKFAKTRKPMGSPLTMKKNLLSSKNTSKMPLFANIITKFSKTVHSRIMSTLYDGCEHFTSLSIFLQIIAWRTRNADNTRMKELMNIILDLWRLCRSWMSSPCRLIKSRSLFLDCRMDTRRFCLNMQICQHFKMSPWKWFSSASTVE